MSHRLQGLYAITDEVLTPDTTVVAQVETALQAGANIVQYRNKSAEDAQIETVCRELLSLCQKHNVPFIIDDRPHLAHKIKADGLHIGKDDGPLSQAREIFPEGIIGVSCYGSIRKAKEAQEEGADYVAFGSFFPSPTKPKSGIISMSVIQKAKEALDIPVCVIGGINSSNIHEIAAHKPDMISVVNDIFNGDIKRNITHLKQGMNI
jgi:thiamine-phosphate pyrophosphorylase